MDQPKSNRGFGKLQHVGALVPAVVQHAKPMTPIQERLISMPLEGEPVSVLYQHSVLCQTCMPYRDPGEQIRTWQRRNGFMRLLIQAGQVLDPKTYDFTEVGLPYGPKPRLVLYHLNAEALRTQSPIIELEDSLTAFVRRTLGLDPKGRNIRIVKDQLSRLAAADFRLGFSDGVHSITIKGTVIKGLELWTPRDSRQKVLWPTMVTFSTDYFESLLAHAVPLNEEAVSRLSHTAMGLDLYAWMAQRLHRVDPKKPALVPWVSLKEQFGQGYDRMDNFKRVLRTTLTQVHTVYREARFDLNDRGMLLHNSRPPVLRRLALGKA